MLPDNLRAWRDDPSDLEQAQHLDDVLRALDAQDDGVDLRSVDSPVGLVFESTDDNHKYVNGGDLLAVAHDDLDHSEVTNCLAIVLLVLYSFYWSWLTRMCLVDLSELLHTIFPLSFLQLTLYFSLVRAL